MRRLSILTPLILLCTMCSSGSEWQDVIDDDNSKYPTEKITYDVKLGIITDAHYSTKENSAGRYYSASKDKITEAVHTFNTAGVEMAISLGDLVDNEYTDYSSIQGELARLSMPMYKILGNHDFITPYSEEQQTAALKVLDISNRYFSVVQNGIRLIFLDSSDIAMYSHPLESKGYREAENIFKALKDDLAPNARSYNGAIGSKQMEWLENELKEAQSLSQNVVCLTHIPLALPSTGNKYTLWNDEDVIDLLTEYTCVKAVIGGHHHEGGYKLTGNIHNITLKGMVQGEENSYSVVHITKNSIRIDGYGREIDNEYRIN